MSRNWILTHGRSGGFLTYDLFASESTEENISSIDECHFTTDGTVVYTYLHFKKYVKRIVIAAFMERMKSERNIILFEIFGYNSIASSDKGDYITDHVGFKMLVDHYTKNNHVFQSCTDGKPGVTRGLLWSQDSVNRLNELVKGRNKRLASFLETMNREHAEYKQKAEMAEDLQNLVNELEVENEELAKYKFTCHVLKRRMVVLDQETRDMLLAVDHRGRPLVI